jgi:type I restriction-modification system DNA methylase subunit
MKWETNNKFDLIIGNPPFVKLIKSPNKHMYTISSNLYIEVPFKCITEHLTDGGILAMVLPSTIQNGTWCKLLRALTFQKKILHFETIRDHSFLDTQAGVSIVVIQNLPATDNSRFIFNGILTEKANEIRTLCESYKIFSD